MIFKTSLVPFALLLINPALSINEGLKAYYEGVGTFGNPTSETPTTQQAENNSANNVLQAENNDTLSKDTQIPLIKPDILQTNIQEDSTQAKDVAPKTGNQLDATNGPQTTTIKNDSQNGNSPPAYEAPVTISDEAVSKAIGEFTNIKGDSTASPITVLNAQIVADNSKQVPDVAKAEQNVATLQQASQLVTSQSKDGFDSSKLQQALQQEIKKDPKNEQAVNDMAFTLVHGDKDGLKKLNAAAKKKLESDPKASAEMTNNLVQFFSETNSMEVLGGMVASMASENPDFGIELLANMFTDAFSINSRSDKQQELMSQLQQTTNPNTEMYPGFQQTTPQQGEELPKLNTGGAQPQSQPQIQPPIPIDPSLNAPPTQPDQKPETNPEQAQEKPLIPEVQQIPSIPKSPEDNNSQDSKPNSSDKPAAMNQVPETNIPLENSGDKPDQKQPEVKPDAKPDTKPETKPDIPSGNNGDLPPITADLQKILEGDAPKSPEDFAKMMAALAAAKDQPNSSGQTDSKPTFFADSEDPTSEGLASAQQPVTAPKPATIPSFQPGPARNPSTQGEFQYQKNPLAWTPQSKVGQAPSFNGQQFQGTFDINRFAIPQSFRAQPQQQQQPQARSNQPQFQNYYNPYFTF